MSYERVSYNGYGYEDPTKNHGGWQRQYTPDDYYFQISRTERMPRTVIDAPVSNFNDPFKREVYVTRHEEHAPVYPNPQSSFNDPFKREVHVTRYEEHAPVYPNLQSNFNNPFGREVYVTRPEEHAPVQPNLRSSSNNTFTREGQVTRHGEHVPRTQEKVHVKKHVHFEQAKDGKHKTYDENVDVEAEDFIKLKHKKFELSKLMSMKGY